MKRSQRRCGGILAFNPERLGASSGTISRGEPISDQSGSSPTHKPAKGWREIIRRVFNAFNDDRVLADAAGVTFYSMLAIFPALAALVSVYGLFSSPVAVEKQVSMLSYIVPGGGIQIISDELHNLASGGKGTLSISLAVSLGIALWSANSGVKALCDSLNVVYRVPENRSFIKLNIVSLAFTVGGLIFVLLALAAVVVLPAVLNFIGLANRLDMLLSLARWPLVLIAILAFLAMLYRYGPSRRPPYGRWITWGSIFAAFAWVILSVLFSWYVANFGSYNKTYGSLGAVIGFMTWIWLSTTLVLIGGELNFETQIQSANDLNARKDRPASRVEDLEERLRRVSPKKSQTLTNRGKPG